MSASTSMEDACPHCGEALNDYGKYLYCFRCSRQFKRRFIGRGLKEIERTIEKDQKKAMGR
jgi:tRNA(Ile2) C34 agmatinyltransferase TiaS